MTHPRCLTERGRVKFEVSFDHMYVYRYIHIYTYVYTHTYIYIYIHTHIYIYTHIYVCIHSYVQCLSYTQIASFSAYASSLSLPRIKFVHIPIYKARAHTHEVALMRMKPLSAYSSAYNIFLT